MGDSPDQADLPPWQDEDVEKPSAAELEAAGQDSMFAPAGEPAGAGNDQQDNAGDTVAERPKTDGTVVGDANQPYRVLARKYRPQTFSQLIGQEPMVRTLANAIERDRLAHAFLMTGVRGVGKTSTARLIAKALNCIGPDGNGGPTIDPCGVCEPCRAISEGRHIDVIEMDAASHTGVDDVREIIEAVRYAAVSARYKIYIIDEVHMLSRNAFNALLKTLEEPPAHVKFLFATTEVEKLPVTVLSRTQRFDLRRIPSELLEQHFAWVCEQEGVEAEHEAVAMIAAAAEGSVRDGLSILDQAIAHADMGDGGKVLASRVRSMLGLADKGAQRRLLETILEGDGSALIAAIDDQYALGVEPLALMRSLMGLVHKITLAQLTGGEPDAPTAEERAALTDWGQRMSPGQLHRLWQLLLKGYDEVKAAPDPLVSAQMALLRVLHASDLPDPGTLARRLEEAARAAPVQSADAGSAGEGGAGNSPAASLDMATLADSAENAGYALAASIMRVQLRVLELAEGRLVYTRAARFSDDIDPELREALRAATGVRWQIEERSGVEGPPSLQEELLARQQAAHDRMKSHPLVEAAFAAFPDAELIEEPDAPLAAQANWSR